MNIEKIRKNLVYRILISIKHSLEYFFVSFFYMFVKKNKYKILSDEETVEKITNERYSISRYGDGEFKWILGIKQLNFQDDDEMLKKKLLSVLQNEGDNSNVLVGIPYFLNSMNIYTFDAKRYWKKFLLKNYKNIKKLLNKDTIYCNSYITRPYLDMKDKYGETIEKRFSNLKKIWKNRDIIIVEGEYSRLGLKNNLFDEAKTIKRIICPPQNAFNKYDEIYSTIKMQNKDSLFILSLGPTATILSYELSKYGYQCIDLGHIDIEYMWYINGCKKKEKIYGKYVNEIGNNGVIADITDDEYNKQIISTIKL